MESDWFVETRRRRRFPSGNVRVPKGSKNLEEEKIFRQENLRVPKDSKSPRFFSSSTS
jgi:hypothetical protein